MKSQNAISSAPTVIESEPITKCTREKCHYVIIRSDLQTGLAGAMILHAAGETGPAPPGSIAILLAAKDEAELRALASLAKDSHLIVECDGPYAGQAMAIGFPPVAERRACYGHLPLWKGGQART